MIRPISIRFAAAVLGVATLLAAAPAPSLVSRYPVAVARTIDATSLVDETDAGAALGGVQIFVAAGLSREPANENGIAALLAECVLRTPVGGVPLRDAIATGGGSISYTIDGLSTRYYVESKPAALPALVALVAKALAAPDVTPQTLASARAGLVGRIADSERSALSVGIAMIRRSLYASGSGLPALGSPATLAALGAHDVANFYKATYVRSAVSFSVVGSAVPALDGSLADVARALPVGAVAPADERVRPIPAEAPRIVAHRDVGAPWIVVGFAAPAPGSADFGAMLVLQVLLANAFERDSATTLGFVERSVGAFYLYDTAPASVVVYVNGTLVDPGVALREVLLASKSLAGKPLGDVPLAHFKTLAEGQFLEDSVSFSDRSYLLGNLAAQGLGPDAINAALAALEKTTGSDVERVAKRYLQRYVVALVLPRQTAAAATGP